jgi:hypothetical protein
MPPLPNAAQVLKVNLGWIDEGDVSAENVLHFKYTGGPPTGAQCATMAAAINAAQDSDFASLLHSTRSIGLCTVRDLTSDMGGEGTAGTVAAGTRAGTQLAPATSVLMNHQIARHYRGGKPRTYLPLGASGDITSGRWLGSFLTDVTTAWVNFISTVLGSGTGCSIIYLCNLSYHSGGALRAVPVTDEVQSSSANPLIGSQRRRNRNQ